MEHKNIDVYLTALGDILDTEEAEPVRLFICGSVALMMQGLVKRDRTRDVDCAGFVEIVDGSLMIERPVLGQPLRNAIQRVARAYSLPETWLSFRSRMLLDNGLPDGLAERLQERQYGERLTIMLASRRDMVFFKLKAAIARDKDLPDLLDMEPTDEELSSAAAWCIEQGATREEVDMVLEQLDRG
ncbi:MAG: hypothetical protein KKB90_02935 [Actinobacteria bacterium]|nr:hypothetical protein [Actinomycetota bacterium]MCG2817744.1 hypothetical protein [Actinomycetes bacterium]MBU4217899.1 hypothetical protein [Actinomycetota bacterium]MBU4360013.1 hypothetical protein [Actinomycetota bacterium]MBU4390960.1 hypothetical protein [Actinomycetota bacterium]